MDLNTERIVVTGGAGFLGRALLAELRRVGVPDSAIAVPRRREFDLTQAADVQRMYQTFAPTVLFHLAAELGGIGANLVNPGRYFYANMAMGLHLIERARAGGVKKFVQIGTVCAYPRTVPVPFREDDLWSGYPEETNAPYGIAKKSLLVMLQAYRRQYGLNGIYLMPTNLYGPGDNFDVATGHVIPALVRKFSEAKSQGLCRVELWGTGGASREFLYVEDAARGIVQAAQIYDAPEPVNLGSGEEITIRDLAKRIAGLVGFEGEIAWDASKPDGQPRRRLDTRRAAERFGFRAAVRLEEGLRRTLAWYRANIGS